jgi:cbb3-type cytochrome oxidase maturation protein
MTSILYLIGISLVMGGIGLAVFLWSLRSGQYDDMEGAASRILFDDAPAPVRPAQTDKSSGS